MNRKYPHRERTRFVLCTFLVGMLVATVPASRLLAADSAKEPLYENNFEQAEPGKLPADVMSLNGDFVVKQEGSNRFLELPGAPLDAFAVMFGPTERTNVMITARIYGTAKGRRYPAFGIGLGGVSGYRLQVTPAKNELEIYKDQDLETSVQFKWKPGTWTLLRLRIRTTGDAEWKVEGKVWDAGATEPADWQIIWNADTEPRAGRASVWGSPFSGTPIRFDDLVVLRTD